MEHVGTEVRRLRRKQKMSQTKLAAAINSGTSVISEIETGRRDPGAGTLRKLASALGVEVGDLFPRTRFSQYLAEAREMTTDELERCTVELTEDLKELVKAPTGLPRQLGGKASGPEKARHLRETTETAEKARAIAQALEERAELARAITQVLEERERKEAATLAGT